MSKNETVENYLEAIHILSLEQKQVHASDIAEYLSFTRPTVSIALKNLSQSGLINIDRNVLTLSEKGQKIAETMYERHQIIGKMLIELGVDEKTAYHDSCLIEHDLSPQTFEAIKNHYLHCIKKD